MKKAFLVYGNDIGLINKTIQRIKEENIEKDNPFGFIEINGQTLDKEPEKLNQENLSISLLGESKLIHIHEPSINGSKIIGKWLKDYNGNNKLLISFFETPVISIRKNIEKYDIEIIKCYKNKEKTKQDILGILDKHNLKIEDKALKEICNCLGNDSQITETETEKLITYHLPAKNTISLEEVKRCIADNRQNNIDDLTHQCANGEKNIDIKDYEPTVIINITLQYFNKLYHCIGNSERIKSTKSQLHFSRQKEFTNHTQKWNSNKILQAIKILIEAEISVKQNYQIAKIICNYSLQKISQLIN